MRCLEARPLLTKAVTSAVAGFIGDVVAQSVAMSTGVQAHGSYDAMRSLRLAAFGGLVGGPLGHYWFQFLDANVLVHAPKSAQAVVSKVALDQLAFSPLGTCIFYAFHTAAEGRPGQYIPTLQDKWWPSLKAGWQFWMPAHCVNFALVPPSQRILYANVMGVIGTYIVSRIANEPTIEVINTSIEPMDHHHRRHAAAH